MNHRNYNFEIQFKHKNVYNPICTLDFSVSQHDYVNQLDQRHGQNTLGFLKELISIIEQPGTDPRSRITQDNEKLRKSNQDLKKQVEEVQHELEEAQEKLKVATTRLRGLNVNPNLAGGGSRSDQLPIAFKNLKNELFYEARTKVWNGWESQGCTFKLRSEEFYKIQSILSKHVFCGGMVYFAKDKAEIDDASHLIVEELLGLSNFIHTSASSKEIQERVKAGLLRYKGVDYSDEALMKYVEKATQLIDLDLQEIANLKTTEEALSEIKKFVESGLRLVRDIVNDPNSGELFMPESGDAFDKSIHEGTKDDPTDKIKMTIYAGYRIAGNILVKPLVITCDPDCSPKQNEVDKQANLASQSTDSQNPQQGDPQNPEGSGDKQIESEAHPNSDDSKSQNVTQGESNSTDNKSSLPDLQQKADENKEPVQQDQSTDNTKITFQGKVTPESGVDYHSEPRKDAEIKGQAEYGSVQNFDAWIRVDCSEDNYKKWYKLAGQDYWVPANFIEGEQPTDLPPMSSEGVSDEPK